MVKQIHHFIKSINKLPHETDMNTETSMNSRAINAEEDPIRYRRPCWILRIAIETTLVFGFGFEFSENGVLVGEAIGSH